MKKYFLFLLILISATSIAQIPEDVLRYSWHTHNGSARYMAIGGAMGSLGGELSASFINPAGLGLFKSGALSFSPAFLHNQNESNYRDAAGKQIHNAFSFGQLGYVAGFSDPTDASKTHAISIGFNQTINFNNHIQYAALNNYSSFSEQFAEEFAKANLSINEVLSSNSPLPYTAAPALYTYLMDTVTINGIVQIKTAPEYLLDSGKSVFQSVDKTTRGGLYELAISFASNIKEKWLYGITLGIPIMSYHSQTTFTESDPTTDTSNKFGSFTYTDNYKTSGVGINAKFGVIYRPKPYIRLGLAIHTPHFLSLSDTRTTRLTTNLEGPIAQYDCASTIFTNNQAGVSKYGFNSAWKAIISGSYVFREEENIKRQRGFLSADVEYVRHRASRFTSNNELPTKEETAYYKQLNTVVKNEYKSCVNVRIGGELKYNVMMGRLGFAYYSNPYKDLAFRAGKTMLSGGLGYRDKGIFIDLTYVYTMSKDVDLPYRLADRDNTFANINQQQGNVVATFGVKF